MIEDLLYVSLFNTIVAYIEYSASISLFCSSKRLNNAENLIIADVLYHRESVVVILRKQLSDMLIDWKRAHILLIKALKDIRYEKYKYTYYCNIFDTVGREGNFDLFLLLVKAYNTDNTDDRELVKTYWSNSFF